MSSVVVSGDTSGAITIAAPAVSGTNTLTLPAVTDTLVGLAATQTLTNKTVTAPVLSGTITGTYTLGGTPTVTGTLTAGTACTKNPVAYSSVTTQAHGLGVVPVFVDAYYECLTADGGYAAGDRVLGGWVGENTVALDGFLVMKDSTNIKVVFGSGVVTLFRKDTGVDFNITLANWKAVATPYKLN